MKRISLLLLSFLMLWVFSCKKEVITQVAPGDSSVPASHLRIAGPDTLYYRDDTVHDWEKISAIYQILADSPFNKKVWIRLQDLPAGVIDSTLTKEGNTPFTTTLRLYLHYLPAGNYPFKLLALTENDSTKVRKLFLSVIRNYPCRTSLVGSGYTYTAYYENRVSGSGTTSVQASSTDKNIISFKNFFLPDSARILGKVFCEEQRIEILADSLRYDPYHIYQYTGNGTFTDSNSHKSITLNLTLTDDGYHFSGYRIVLTK